MGARLTGACASVSIRPVQPSDVPGLDAFVRNLSAHSRQRRFHGAMAQLPPDLLHRFTHPNPDVECSVLAVATEAGRETLVGEARYAIGDGSAQAREFALTVADAWQRRGIGAGLLRSLAEHAAMHGVERLYGDVLRDNLPMIALAESECFGIAAHPAEQRLLRVAKDLAATRSLAALVSTVIRRAQPAILL